MTIDTSAVDYVLSTTRAVRRRLDLNRAVEPEIIESCLELAIQAPTGGNRQGWRWVVVTDPGKRKALAEIYRAEAGILHTLLAKAEADGDQQTQRVYRSAIEFAGVLDQVPVHVIPCQQGRVEGLPNGVLSGFYGSIIPAVWSFMLALRSRGLGSAWTTLHLNREQEAAAVLGIPEDVTQVALIPVAYTVGTDFKPARRRPAAEITYWNGWGEG
jgi:nitroreductase